MSAGARDIEQGKQAIWQAMEAADSATLEALAPAFAELQALSGIRLDMDDELYCLLPCSDPLPGLTPQERAQRALVGLQAAFVQVLRCGELRGSFVALDAIQRDN